MRVRILRAFTSSPDGYERKFVPGDEPDDLDDETKMVFVQKGLAEEIEPRRVYRRRHSESEDAEPEA